MEIHLSPELEATVEQDVASGRFSSVEEYISVAVESLHQRQFWPEETLDEQREKMEAAWQEAERGELISIDELRRDMQEMKTAWKAARQSH